MQAARNAQLRPRNPCPFRERRATEKYNVRVAVWDMDNVFPELDGTLRQMNAAQKEFGFELVRQSVPLGVWDLRQGEEKLLWAERLANRLRGMPVELEVDVLACITRHPMRDNEWDEYLRLVAERS